MTKQLITTYEVAELAEQYYAKNAIPLDWKLDYSFKRIHLTTSVVLSDIETCEFDFKYNLKTQNLTVKFKTTGIIKENEDILFKSEYISKEKNKKQVRNTLSKLFSLTDNETLADIQDSLYNLLGTQHYETMMKGVQNASRAD